MCFRVSEPLHPRKTSTSHLLTRTFNLIVHLFIYLFIYSWRAGLVVTDAQCLTWIKRDNIKTICDMEPVLTTSIVFNIFCLGASSLPSCFPCNKCLLKVSLCPRSETRRHPLFMINYLRNYKNLPTLQSILKITLRHYYSIMASRGDRG